MRLIDADALIKALQKTEAEPTYQHTGEDWCTGLIIAEDIVWEQPTIEPQKWIPCSERLPELYKPVLVTGGDVIWICELIESPDLDDGEFQWEDKMLGHWYSFDNWDAWMPLPPAYNGGEQE